MSQLFLDDGPTKTGLKVMLATTVYENPAAAYTFAISRSREAMKDAGIQSAYLLLTGNCHVDDARNSVVQEFLLSDCDELIFLDADVCWEPVELIKLCQFRNEHGIVGGVYPYRRDDEESKKKMPLVMYPETGVDDQGLIEVAGLPTGFMRIHRRVFDTLSENAHKYWKRDDKRMQVPILFERTFFDGVRLGGDLSFCKKWIEAGGKVMAAPELHLGHVAKGIIWDSLGAFLRRQDGTTLKNAVKRLQKGDHDAAMFAELRKAYSNQWGALEDVLLTSAVMAHQAKGPIIEAGSGLTTVILAASTNQTVYSLEHDPEWFNRTMKMLEDAGLTNVKMIHSPIKDGWYSLDGVTMPKHFSLGLNDGPPRVLGNRMGFFHNLSADSIICDDADDEGYASALKDYANLTGRRIDFVERAAIIR